MSWREVAREKRVKLTRLVDAMAEFRITRSYVKTKPRRGGTGTACLFSYLRCFGAMGTSSFDEGRADRHRC